MLVRELLFKLGFNSIDAERNAKKMDRVVVGLKRNLARMGAAAFAASGATTLAFARMSDEYASLDARLKQVTKSSEEFAAAQDSIFKIAQKTRNPIQAITDLYVKTAQSVEDIPEIQEKQISQMVEAFNNALTLSGARGPAREAAILQFGQGLGSKALGGDELRTLRETNFQFIRALMLGSNKSYKEIMKMAEQRKLTPEFIFKAIDNQAADLERRFLQLPRTGGQAYTQFMNIIFKKTGEISQKTGSMAGFVAVFDRLIEIVESPDFERAFIGMVESFTLFLRLLAEVIGLLARFISLVQRAIDNVGGLNRVLRVLGSILAVLAARQLYLAIAGLVTLVSQLGLAFTASWLLAGAMGVLSAVMAALPLVFVLTMLALIIEDLWNFASGNESVTGRLMKAWEDYAWFFGHIWDKMLDKIAGWVDSFMDFIRPAIEAWESFKGGVENFRGSNLNPANWFDGPQPAPALAMARSGNVNRTSVFQPQVSITVPPGTMREQVDYMDNRFRGIMDDYNQRQLREALNNYPEVE